MADRNLERQLQEHEELFKKHRELPSEDDLRMPPRVTPQKRIPPVPMPRVPEDWMERKKKQLIYAQMLREEDKA